MGAELRDSHGRVMRDLRVSITDRCNFRCLYCLPETEEAADFYRTRFDSLRNPRPGASIPIQREWKARSELLSFEEIVRVVRIAAGLGIQKVRVTGGEPLLRQGVESLVAALTPIPGVTDVAMTTNGALFAAKAAALRKAGLHRVSFSMDSLDRENFRRMTGRDGLQGVLDGLRIARGLGFDPIKVNAVVIRDLNDHEIPDLAAFAQRENLQLRFIEFMPLDSKRAWQRERVLPGREILERLASRFSLSPVSNPGNPSETARRWKMEGGGEIGIIAPVTEPFCGHCNRLRLTADGKLRTCLFSLVEHDLRPLLRGSSSDEAIAGFLLEKVSAKEAGHRIGQADFQQPARTMSCIGG